jgi:hypothetical protein
LLGERLGDTELETELLGLTETLGLCEELGLVDGDTEGLIDALGDTLGDNDGESETLGLRDGETEVDGDTETEGETETDGEIETLGETDGESETPSSVIVATTFKLERGKVSSERFINCVPFPVTSTVATLVSV